MKATRGMKRSVTVAVLTALFFVLSHGAPAAAVDWMIYVRESDGKRVVKHTDEQWYVANPDGSPDTTQPVAVGGITIDFIDNLPNTAQYSVHMGANNTASGWDSTALGAGNTASGVYSTALGSYNTASGWRSTALGVVNEASEAGSTALGWGNEASGLYSTALGAGNKASWWSTALGVYNTASGGVSTALGAGNEASGDGSTALGYNNTASGESSTAVGGDNTASGHSSTALGSYNTASGWRSTALGVGNEASGSASVAIGSSATVTAHQGVALGADSLSDRPMIAPGAAYVPAGADGTAVRATVKGNYGAVSVGNSAGTRQITNVAAGSADTDAANVAQLKAAADSASSQIRESGASAAALAGLKPMQYDPMEPSQFMIGAGHYRGDWAVALGLSHYARENVLIHAGVAFGGDHAMINAGMTWKFGDGGRKAALPERYRKGPISSVYVMQQENIQLQEKVQEQDRRIAQLDQENAGIRAENAEIKETNAAQAEKIAAMEAQLAAIMKKLNMK